MGISVSASEAYGVSAAQVTVKRGGLGPWPSAGGETHDIAVSQPRAPIVTAALAGEVARVQYRRSEPAPRWRRFPPVHSALPPGALRAAAASCAGAAADEALREAQQSIVRAFGRRHVALLNSGTSALQAGLLATAPRATRQERCVALPAFACPDVATAALGAGFRVRLYDLDPRTLQPDLASVQAVLALGVSHVVVVHLYGRVVDVPAMVPITEAHGCQLVEDAAQHAGGTLAGRRTGSLAPIAVLSFGRGKGLNAAGGGALLWDEAILGAIPAPPPTLRAGLWALGAAAAANLLAHPLLYRVPAAIPWLGIGETRYHPPRSLRGMSATCAALLVAALAAEPEMLEARQAVERWYAQQLADRAALLLEPLPGSVSGALRFPVLIDPAVGRALAPLGVARSYPRTLAEYPPIASALEAGPPTPGAALLARMLHTLPTHPLLGDCERRQIVHRLLEVG